MPAGAGRCRTERRHRGATGRGCLAGRARPGAGTNPGAVPPSRPATTDGITTGTGFFIGPDTIVTNYHVAGGCRTIRVRKSGADLGGAKVIALSRSDDLAAPRTEAPSKSFLKLRVGAPIRPAEAVLVFGYPLAGSAVLNRQHDLGQRHRTHRHERRSALPADLRGGPARQQRRRGDRRVRPGDGRRRLQAERASRSPASPATSPRT